MPFPPTPPRKNDGNNPKGPLLKQIRALSVDPDGAYVGPQRRVERPRPGGVQSCPSALEEDDVDVDVDLERAERRPGKGTRAGGVTSSRPDPPGGGIQSKNSDLELSTKPTWEESSADDTDIERPSRERPGSSNVDNAPINFAAATAAAVAAVSAIHPQPAAASGGAGGAVQNPQQRSVQFERSFVDDDVLKQSAKKPLNVDTTLPPPPAKEVPKEAASKNYLASPAESTVATEPPTPNSTVTIEHVHKGGGGSRSRSGGGMLMTMKKPLMAILGAYLVGITGLSAFLAQQWMTIPGLETQIERLGEEVDRLEVQVDRLEKENDRFATLNDELEANNEEYSRQNDRLEASNAYYAELNGQLNASNVELERLNGALNASNVEYARLNDELTETTRELNTQVDHLEVLNMNLTDTLFEYIQLSEGLSNETDRLDDLNDDLSRNLVTLNGTLSELRTENGRLTLLLDDLTTVTHFLNETAQELDRSYELIAEYLADQIVANRVILSETIHNTFKQETIGWECAFQMRYATRPYGYDGTAVIPVEDYEEILDYVDRRVLVDMCLDRTDFEAYLATRMGLPSGTLPPLVGMTTNDLVPAISRYSLAAQEYYFPDPDDPPGGLTEFDWSDAEYRCRNLPEEKKFLMERAVV